MNHEVAENRYLDDQAGGNTGMDQIADEYDYDSGNDLSRTEPAAGQDMDAIRAQIEKEILFQVQGVGSVKTIGGIEVYVKSQYCEESLRELIKHLKNDNAKEPLIKHTLTKWQFLIKDCLPLLVMHA